MKIDINHAQVREGFVFKTTYYGVSVTVTFSEAELQVIKQQRLSDEIFMEREPPANIKNGGNWNLKVKHLLKGKKDTYLCATVLDAKAYENQLIEALQLLKNVIDVSSDEGTAKTIEL